VGPIFATLSCFTHTTPHPIFSQSEHVEASSSPTQLYHKYGRKHSFHWPYFNCLQLLISSIVMDSQDSRFTTPPPRIYGLYDINTPPSAQPRSPPFKIPESQQTTQSWDSHNGPRPQINESQLFTQSWDSRDDLRPVTEPLTPELLAHSQLLPNSLTQPSPPLFVPDSQADSSQEFSPLRSHVYNPSHVECTRDKRLQIQTALLFKIPWT
jgi:hypothetical protein